MKTEQTSQTPDRDSTSELSPPRRLARRIAHGIARAVYELCHHVWSVVIVLFCIIAYLWAIGLPDQVTEALIQRVSTGPFQVTIDRLRVDPLHGLVADGVRLFEKDKDSKSLLRIERLGLGLDWRALARNEFILREVRVSNGTLRWPEVEPAGNPLEMKSFSATVGLSTGVIRIAGLSMTAFGAPLVGQGVILFEPGAEPA